MIGHLLSSNSSFHGHCIRIIMVPQSNVVSLQIICSLFVIMAIRFQRTFQHLRSANDPLSDNPALPLPPLHPSPTASTTTFSSSSANNQDPIPCISSCILCGVHLRQEGISERCTGTIPLHSQQATRKEV